MDYPTLAESQGDGDHDMVVMRLGESLDETADISHEESTSAFTQSESNAASNVEQGRRRPWRIMSSLFPCILIYLVLCLKVLQCLPVEYSLSKLSLLVVLIVVCGFACILSLFLFQSDMRRLRRSSRTGIAERAEEMLMALLVGLPMSHDVSDGDGDGDGDGDEDGNTGEEHS